MGAFNLFMATASDFWDRPRCTHRIITIRHTQKVLRDAIVTRGAADRGGHQVENQALRRLRCTSNSEIAAGVTPDRRAAWPSVAGRCAESFWRASTDRPRTLW